MIISHTCAYQGINVSFLENFANVLNEWSLIRYATYSIFFEVFHNMTKHRFQTYKKVEKNSPAVILQNIPEYTWKLYVFTK